MKPEEEAMVDMCGRHKALGLTDHSHSHSNHSNHSESHINNNNNHLNHFNHHISVNNNNNNNHNYNNNNPNQRPIELVFQNISVSIETKSSKSKPSQQKQILSDISGFGRPGQVLAVMGPSGSGKTTLLSALSGRLKPSCGCITLNGEAINKQLRRKICYVLQQDIFFPSLTLRQTLTVSNTCHISILF